MVVLLWVMDVVVLDVVRVLLTVLVLVWLVVVV